MNAQSIRVPTQVHTRKLDRLVSHKNMKRAGLRRVNKYEPSYFAKHWKDTVDVPTIDLRRKTK